MPIADDRCFVDEDIVYTIVFERRRLAAAERLEVRLDVLRLGDFKDP